MKLLLFLLLTTLSATAQDYAWVRQIGGPARDAAGEIVVDAAGNSYVTGSFRTSIVLGTTTHQSAGGFDLFIAKYSPAGQVLWSVRAGGSGDDAGTSIALAPDGVYVSGSFQQSALFGTTALTGDGTGAERDGFVARYTADGDLVWARKTGSHASQGAPMIAAGPGGALFMTASFSGSVTLGGSTFTAGANSLRDIFVARYTAAGDVDWARHIKARRTATAKSITAGVDGVHVSGTFVDTLTVGTTVLAPNFFEDVFIGHYSDQGDFKWARAVQGRYFEATAGVAGDGLGNSYLAGTFSDSIIIGSTSLKGNRSGTDIFLVKFDRDGRIVWLKGGRGASIDNAYDIASDSLGNLFMTGTFVDTLRFDEELLIAPRRNQNTRFIARFLPTGELDYAELGTGAVVGRSIALDPQRNVMMTGEFAGQVGFRGFPLETSDSADIYVAKLVRTTPGAPKLRLPPYESEYLLPTIAFRWKPLAEATRYELQFAPDSTFTLGMLSHFSDRSSTTVPFLQDSSRYYWRVRGYIGEQPGAWSKIWWFSTREQNLVNDFRWLDTTTASIHDVATDRAGNSYVIGVPIAPVSAIAGDTVRLSEGAYYIAKIDPSGRAGWAGGIKGTSMADTDPIICLDSTGGIFMASGFAGARVIGGSTIGADVLTTFYLAKITGEGVVEWAIAPLPAATGYSAAYVRDIAADRAGNIYVTGHMTGTVSFGSHTVGNNRPAGGMLFITKYSPTGEALWVKASQGEVYIFESGIAVDPDGNVYVGGEFMDTLDIGGTQLRARYLDQPVNYIIHLGTDGTFKWGQTAGAGGDLGQFGGVSVDRQGNGFLAGNYSDYATFGGVGGSPIDTLRDVGTGSSFLAKYAPSGAVIFARPIGGGITRAEQLVVDIHGNAYIGGTYTNYGHFEGGSPHRNENQNLFVKKVAPDGSPDWIATATGWTDTTFISPYGLGVDSLGNAYVGGSWVGYPHFGIFELASEHIMGWFLAKIGDPGSAPYSVIAPIDGATDQNRSLLLVWAPVPGALSYDLEVSDRPDFAVTFRRESELIATEYLLTGLSLDHPYFWRVRANMGSGPALEWSEIWRFTTRLKDSVTGVRTQTVGGSVGALSLAVRPNPFSARSIVSYALPGPADLRIELFEASGRSFGSLFEGRVAGGAHAMTIDGEGLVPGVYFVRVTAGAVVETIEIVVQ